MTAVLDAPATTGQRERPFVTDLPRTSAPPVNWRLIAQALCLVLLPCVCYWPALNGAFLWDDNTLITNRPLVRGADGLSQIWFSTVPFDYFPLTNTSFWAEWKLWGDDSLGYHVVNLALHLTSAFLFWRLLKVLRIPGAWFGALLFAVHPVNVASVAWIAERKNVLSMVFYFGSLICYVRSQDGPDNRGVGKRYYSALALFVLAVLSKSSVVMLPCVLLLLAWWQRGKITGRDLWRSLPFFAVSLAGGLLTVWFQYHRAITPGSDVHAVPLIARVPVASHAILFYLGKTLWPVRLSMLYPLWAASAVHAADFLWPVALLALLATALSGRKFWGRGPFLALGYFALTLLPVSGLLHMSFFRYSNVSDHLAYVSVPGLLALAAAVLGTGYVRGGGVGQGTLAVMTASVALLCLGCYQRAEEFSSPEHLWRATLEVNPRSPDAHDNLGLAFESAGNLTLAESHYREALRLQPHMDEAGTNLANVMRMESRWAEAADVYRRVLAFTPDPRTYNNYAVTLLELGDNAKAREALQNALRLEPSMENAYFNLYRLALNEHDVRAAGEQLRTCLRLDPDNVQALLALVALNIDQPPGTPPLPPSAAEAVLALAERACQLTDYRNASALWMLSKALVAADRRTEAIAIGRRAREAATQSNLPELAAAVDGFLRSMQP